MPQQLPPRGDKEAYIKDGIIIKGIGGAYHILLENKEISVGKPRGLFRNEGITPTVGDRVSVVPSGDSDFPLQIVEIHERRNILVRPPISNLDVLIILVSCKRPAPDYKLIDKLLIICAVKNIHPVIWITKTDLDEKRAEKIKNLYEEAGFSVFSSSLMSFEKAPLEDFLKKGKTIAFAGQSGVGKSTLCNRILGEGYMEVGIISKKLQRGKHTTRHVELIPYGDKAFIADTPGFSSMRLFDVGVEEKEVVLGYPELLRIKDQCRFQDCRHMNEDGCAVSSVAIDNERLLRYREFTEELKNQKKY